MVEAGREFAVLGTPDLRLRADSSKQAFAGERNQKSRMSFDEDEDEARLLSLIHLASQFFAILLHHIIHSCEK
jgi:hypothetical protein